MSDTSLVFSILAKDNASSTFGKVGRSMAAIAGGVIGGNLVLGGLSKAFDFAKGAAIDFNSELQQSTIAFTTMLGSGQKSKAFLDQLQNFAKTTPFEFGNLVSNAQQMMGMGIAAKDVIPDLKALGDSVASIGGSAQQVDSVTLAFDQMTAKGTLDMGNMNQLMQNGVPSALKVLASSYHVTTGAMIKMISTGKVQSSDALPKLIAGIEKGTASTAALGGMMDKQSQTFSGAMSNISDSLTQALAGAFRPFFGIVSKGAQGLATLLGSPAFTAFGDRISKALGNVIGIFQYFVGFITGKGSDAIDGFSTKAFTRVDKMATFVDAAFQSIKKIVGNVIAFVKNTVIPIGKDLIKTFGPLILAGVGIGIKAFEKLSGILKPVGGVLKDVFGFIADHKTTFQAIAVAVLTVVGAMKAWTIATTVWSAVTKAATAVQVALDVAMDANPIGLIILAVMALVAAFVYLWTHSEAFRKFWIGLWNDIWGFLKAVGRWFAGPFANFFVTGYRWVIDAAKSVWKWMKSIWGDIWDFIKGIGHWFSTTLPNFFVNAWNTIKNKLIEFDVWLIKKFYSIVDFFKGIPGKISNAAKGMWDGIKNAFKGVVNWIIGAWNSLHFTIPSIDTHIPGIGKIGGFTVSVPQLPYMATGGDVTRGGYFTVGEKGTETVYLPAGSRVEPHGAQHGPQQICIHFDGDLASLFTAIGARVRTNYGGSVQVALGGHG